jgi:hypothetical protein
VRFEPSSGRSPAVASSRQGGAPLRPPGVVQASVSDRTLSRCSSARCCAIMPPIEAPITCADSTAASSITARASCARPCIDSRPRTGEEFPVPRLSNTIARWRRAIQGSSRNHSRELAPRPMIISTGSPRAPASCGPSSRHESHPS